MLNLSIESPFQPLPTEAQFTRWFQAALQHPDLKPTLTLHIVETEAMQALNKRYRGKDKTTNVLAFEDSGIPGFPAEQLGDIMICAEVVSQEAHEKQLPLEAHWAHMLIHGVLHLQGYDHKSEDDASIMEERETRIMLGLGFADPHTAMDKE